MIGKCIVYHGSFVHVVVNSSTFVWIEYQELRFKPKFHPNAKWMKKHFWYFFNTFEFWWMSSHTYPKTNDCVAIKISCALKRPQSWKKCTRNERGYANKTRHRSKHVFTTKTTVFCRVCCDCDIWYNSTKKYQTKIKMTLDWIAIEAIIQLAQKIEFITHSGEAMEDIITFWTVSVCPGSTKKLV